MVLQMSRPSKITSSDTYYFRKRVPADLVGIVGRREIRVSLGTKDPTLAKELFRQKEQEIENEWKSLRATPEPLTHKQIVALAGKAYHDLTELLHDEAGEPEIWEHFIRLGDDAAKVQKLEQWYGDDADKLLRADGIAIDAHSRERLLFELHSAYRQAAEHLLKQASGDYSPDPKANRFPVFNKSITPKTTCPSYITLTQLFERWRDDHLADNKAAGTVVDYQQKLNSLIKFLGHEDAKAVTPKDIGNWVEHLRHKQGLSAKTVANKYLVTVKRLYNAVIQKGEQVDNPAQKISVSIPKRIKERSSGFTDEEATTILSAALHIDDIPSRRPKLNKTAIRWVPWICAYTGSRCGEIAQLRTDDLVEEYGVMCLRITPEAGTVKTREFRLVPLHPHLIETGLPQFIRSQPHGQLFIKNLTKDEATEDLASRAGEAVKMLGKWVREGARITDKRVQPNHAWRHRFKTVARDSDIPPEYMNAIQGHSDGRAASDYGEITVRTLHREILKIPYYKAV